MKRMVVAALLLAAALAGYRWYAGSFAPQQQYKKFAEEMLRRRYDLAAAMTTGMSAEELSALGSQEQTFGGPSMFQTLFPSKYKFESQKLAPDGTLSMHVVQTVLFNPPGVESAMPSMYATLRQTVTMKKVEGAWKVASFENKLEQIDSMRRR